MAPYVFWTSIGASVIAYTPPIVDAVRSAGRLFQPMPIEVHDQVAQWVDARTLEITSKGATWNRTCPAVSINRLLLLTNGSYVAVAVEVISGPLKGKPMDPRYTMSITPQERDPSVFRVHVPDWVDPEDVQYYVTNGLVPDSFPCTDGFTGPWRISSIAVPKRPKALSFNYQRRQHYGQFELLPAFHLVATDYELRYSPLLWRDKKASAQ